MSAVDEDGVDASFAGQHLTLLNVPSAGAPGTPLREIWWSANSDSAISYHERVGLSTHPSVAVIVQVLLDPEKCGGHFGEVALIDERVFQSWSERFAVVRRLDDALDRQRGSRCGLADGVGFPRHRATPPRESRMFCRRLRHAPPRA